jgi:hypothetical protein
MGCNLGKQRNLKEREHDSIVPPDGSKRDAVLGLNADTDTKLRTAFELYDTNKDGKISKRELAVIMEDLTGGLQFSADEIEHAFRDIDTSGDQKISFEEFKNFYARGASQGPSDPEAD